MTYHFLSIRLLGLSTQQIMFKYYINYKSSEHLRHLCRIMEAIDVQWDLGILLHVHRYTLSFSVRFRFHAILVSPQGLATFQERPVLKAVSIRLSENSLPRQNFCGDSKNLFLLPAPVTRADR